MNPTEAIRWRTMTAPDLAAVAELATRVHPNYPERPEVLAEKFRLFPAGCFTLAGKGAVHGYCFSHPWLVSSPPSLDVFLGELPKQPDSFFIHDLTLDASAQRRSLAAKLVPDLVHAARAAGLSHMTLVAVNGSAPFWSRMGFRRTADEAVQETARAKYDAVAVHMEQRLDQRS
jgi:ribosomal protein S18 acetylase RimI-like enzyme